MTSFVHTEYAMQHAGGSRTGAAVQVMQPVRGGFDSARGLAAMLLAAIVSALLVVTDQMIETWADGRLMAAWVGLWVVGFIAIVLLSGTVRRFSGNVVKELDAWSARVAQARADERLWAIALKDARVMADLQAALARADAARGLSANVVERARTYQFNADQA